MIALLPSQSPIIADVGASDRDRLRLAGLAMTGRLIAKRLNVRGILIKLAQINKKNE